MRRMLPIDLRFCPAMSDLPSVNPNTVTRKNWCLVAAILCLAGFLLSLFFAWLHWEPAIRLVVKQPQVELPFLRQQQKGHVSFQLMNRGRETIEIMSIESTCTCSVAELDQYQISPGKSVLLRATLSTGNHMGPISSRIAVVFRAQGSSQLYSQLLEICGNVEATTH